VAYLLCRCSAVSLIALLAGLGRVNSWSQGCIKGRVDLRIRLDLDPAEGRPLAEDRRLRAWMRGPFLELLKLCAQ
jgi:hypothetical protein